MNGTDIQMAAMVVAEHTRDWDFDDETKRLARRILSSVATDEEVDMFWEGVYTAHEIHIPQEEEED